MPLQDDTDVALQPVEKIRLEDRFAFVTHLTFRSQDGFTSRGSTKDVSLNGAFVATDIAVENVSVGDQGEVEIEVEGYTITIPCTVTRVTPQGLGLAFEDS